MVFGAAVTFTVLSNNLEFTHWALADSCAIIRCAIQSHPRPSPEPLTGFGSTCLQVHRQGCDERGQGCREAVQALHHHQMGIHRCFVEGSHFARRAEGGGVCPGASLSGWSGDLSAPAGRGTMPMEGVEYKRLGVMQVPTADHQLPNAQAS